LGAGSCAHLALRVRRWWPGHCSYAAQHTACVTCLPRPCDVVSSSAVLGGGGGARAGLSWIEGWGLGTALQCDHHVCRGCPPSLVRHTMAITALHHIPAACNTAGQQPEATRSLAKCHCSQAHARCSAPSSSACCSSWWRLRYSATSITPSAQGRGAQPLQLVQVTASACPSHTGMLKKTQAA